MKKTIKKLLDSNMSSYAISKNTGVDAPTIQRVRSGERKLGNLTLDKAEKLYNYQKEVESNESND
ncbi:XRE family transcriptional regulator [Staphylococcus sp. 17KM0847]|uniref:XRE family transcriptional regulator n=1 Tax=Staphylococcus sp. 17KM0847 TaxID=2583989 RepID=UPI0015DCDE16|nr:XRE family transcriptional regulator [Staphylococcus sp. 17KM0847]QLK85924.1 XRE family transcriptional regulator [Staphylococcus sp. 17KM0847]